MTIKGVEEVKSSPLWPCISCVDCQYTHRAEEEYSPRLMPHIQVYVRLQPFCPKLSAAHVSCPSSSCDINQPGKSAKVQKSSLVRFPSCSHFLQILIPHMFRLEDPNVRKSIDELLHLSLPVSLTRLAKALAAPLPSSLPCAPLSLSCPFS